MTSSSLRLPVVEPGLLMVNIGPTMVIHLGAVVSAEVYQLQLDALAQAIDQRVSGQKVTVLYDMPALMNVSARQRKLAGEMLAARREKLRGTTAGFALATPSAVGRGILSAIFWLAPPPYPYTVVDTTAEGFVFLARQQPGIDPRASEQQYRALLTRHRAALHAPPGSSPTPKP
jgi:hypothetical protein